MKKIILILIYVNLSYAGRLKTRIKAIEKQLEEQIEINNKVCHINNFYLKKYYLTQCKFFNNRTLKSILE